MAEPAQRAATYEDLLAVPENLVAEILFGHLVTHPRSAPLLHNATVSALSSVLWPVVLNEGRDPEAWICLYRPEVHIGPHVLVPDLAAWRRKRLTPLPEAWIDTAPAWACEVLSPETKPLDRGEKRIIYAKAGVRHLWHVDPVLRMLEVFELRDGKWLLLDVYRDNAAVAAPPFADVSFPLGLLWPFDSPTPKQA
jgi:Uma2 family endonuclease